MGDRITHLPGNRCPTCGAKNDGTAEPGRSRPSPGDYSVCAYCAGVACFDADLRLQAVPPDEVPPEVARVAAAWRTKIRPH